MERLILASGSPQRKRILTDLRIPFTAIPSDIDEHHAGLKKPAAICKSIALRKALAVADENPNSWVIGVDTLVAIKGGRILGKPKNRLDAERAILAYKKSYCDVYSGIALVHKALKKKKVVYEKTRLFFHNFTKEDVQHYLDKNEWQGSSGSMTIEGEGGKLVRKMVGEYWNVVGLPINSLKKLLKFANISKV